MTRMVFPAAAWAYAMHHVAYEPKKNRCKYRCPKAYCKKGCFCETPCSPAQYSRTVHTQLKDNSRIFNIPPRDSKEWNKEYDRRTSVEHSNKHEKQDYKLEDGRHRSTKMWCCRRYVYFLCTKISSFFNLPIFNFQSALKLNWFNSENLLWHR